MGMSDKKQTSTTTSNSSLNTTMTPTNPLFSQNLVSGLAGNITNLAGQDPYSFIAGPSALQTQAGQGASALGQNADAYNVGNVKFNQLASSPANTYDPATVTPNSLLPSLSKYMSPYTNDVVNASLADYNVGANQQLAQNKLDLGGDDTFGGTGGAVGRAALQAGLTRGLGTLSSTLRDQAFNTGASLAGQDADRRQQAQMFNANNYNTARQFNANANDTALARQAASAQGLLGVDTTKNADARANIGTQSDLGGILQQLLQAHQGAPITTLSALSGAAGSLPLDLFRGQDTSATGTNSSYQVGTNHASTMDQIGQGLNIASSLASLFSDERLKEDIQTVGHDAKGRRWVSYRYLWDDPEIRHTGVIAQEVAKTDPHAVSRHESGYLMVNYGELR